jgi:hypothetical protein
MRTSVLKWVLLGLTFVGLVLTWNSAIFRQQRQTLVGTATSTHGIFYDEYPWVNLAAGLAVFSGLTALGAAIIAAAEVRNSSQHASNRTQ